MRKVQFENDNLYHVYNRGTEKRNVFLDDADHYRFIHYLYELSNANFNHNLSRDIEGGLALLNSNSRDLLVEIIAFCLMPNHFHLILRQLQENGIAQFMQKLGTGYTMYFNKKNKRSGSLFQGTFKAIQIEHDEYLMHLSRYIHINPVELIESGWKKEGIKNWERINEFLENYRWSSYLDYIGIKNFPSVTNRNVIMSSFPDGQSYKNFINQWLDNDLEFIKETILE
jgi:putative transposase